MKTSLKIGAAGFAAIGLAAAVAALPADNGAGVRLDPLPVPTQQTSPGAVGKPTKVGVVHLHMDKTTKGKRWMVRRAGRAIEKVVPVKFKYSKKSNMGGRATPGATNVHVYWDCNMDTAYYGLAVFWKYVSMSCAIPKDLEYTVVLHELTHAVGVDHLPKKHDEPNVMTKHPFYHPAETFTATDRRWVKKQHKQNDYPGLNYRVVLK